MKILFSILAALTISACSSAKSGNTGGDDDVGVDAPPFHHDPDGPPPSTAKRTIYTIILENHDYDEIIGSPNAPYINSLLAHGGLATNYKDTIHPSLGNYLHMISGENQYPGFIDIDPTQAPYFPADKPNLGTQLETAAIKWRSYQESMGTPCRLTANGKYAPKHDPFLYFKDMQTTANGDTCKRTNVDFTNFAADMATNDYRYMWITPNLDSDGHDPSNDPALGMRNSDAWMAIEVPKILASAGYQAGGILFITWDEAEGRMGDPDKIPMIILSPKLKAQGMTSATAFTHASYAATIEDLLSLPRLATVTAAPSLMEFLNP